MKFTASLSAAVLAAAFVGTVTAQSITLGVFFDQHCTTPISGGGSTAVEANTCTIFNDRTFSSISYPSPLPAGFGDCTLTFFGDADCTAVSASGGAVVAGACITTTFMDGRETVGSGALKINCS